MATGFGELLIAPLGEESEVGGYRFSGTRSERKRAWAYHREGARAPMPGMIEIGYTRIQKAGLTHVLIP